jgi:hypothetical protein
MLCVAGLLLFIAINGLSAFSQKASFFNNLHDVYKEE